MRICYIVPNLDVETGWGRYTSDLLCGIKARGRDTSVVAVKSGARGFIHAVLCARREVKDCDIIHALDIYPYGVIAYLARLFSGKKFVLNAQGTYAIEPLYMAKTAFLAKLACKSADVIIAISNFTKEELRKRVKSKNIVVINHGIDLKKFYCKRLPTDEEFILSVGALKRRKGYHVSIPAFALAKKHFPNLKYKIVGSKDDVAYFDELRKLAKKYRVFEDIEFFDSISDEALALLYQRAKLFILTSININHNFEGFGLVFLEAAAAGLPVIGTLGNGIEDGVKSGYNGILVPQNDIKKTSGILFDMLSNKNKWQNMSRASYEWAKGHKLENVIEKYLNVYEEILSKDL